MPLTDSTQERIRLYQAICKAVNDHGEGLLDIDSDELDQEVVSQIAHQATGEFFSQSEDDIEFARRVMG